MTILGVGIDDVTETEALEHIAGFVATGRPHHIITVNPEFTIEARHNQPFRRALEEADLATPDGVGLVLVAKLRGKPLRGRVTGVGLVGLVAAEAARRGWSVFLLGAGPGVAEEVASRLQLQHPQLHIAGCYAGSPQPEDEPHILALIEQARPDVLLVAYGTPAQELWINRNRQHLRASAIVGVGGAFDFIAGRVPRAPRWMQRIGLEWLYRLIRQPWRWRRIVNAVPVFLWLALRERRRK